jgi:hypothetical protein
MRRRFSPGQAAEALRVCERPICAAHPLCRHDVRDLLRHAHGRRGCRRDQLPGGIVNFLLAIYSLEAIAECRSVEAAFAECLEPLDEPLEARLDELKALRLDELAPAMTSELPPARWQIRGARVVDLEQLGIERLGPQRVDAMDAVARQAGAE